MGDVAEPAQRPWYFGAFCEACGAFLPVGRDESGGRPGERFSGGGTVILTCSTCGHHGRYAASRLEQRRAEPRRAEPRA
jgi:RNase P subunit RPR2